MSTKIEWTEETWNPIAGCSIVSPGCQNCYAMRMAGRLEAMGQKKYRDLTWVVNGNRVWTGQITFDRNALSLPLKRKKPTMYFVNSMSDLFHGGVSDSEVRAILTVIAACPQHTFQVLTKRADHMADVISELQPKPLPNLWLGVSVENQKAADERIPHLLKTPAAVRFLSCEPLLGPVDLSRVLMRFYCPRCDAVTNIHACPVCGTEGHGRCRPDWVIVGGESGPGARPMHPDWARSLRDQCQAAGVPFFFKQWGEWLNYGNLDYAPSIKTKDVLKMEWLSINGERSTATECPFPPKTSKLMMPVGKKAAGRLLDGREWNEKPAVIEN